MPRATSAVSIGFPRCRTRRESRSSRTEDGLRKLVAAAKEAGEDHIVVETSHDSGDAWIRAGFSEVTRILTAPAEAIESHLGREREPSFGSIHVQSDDLDAIVRAVRQFVPRLPEDLPGASSFRRATGGRPSTTS